MLLFLDGNIACMKKTKYSSITNPYSTSGFAKGLLQGICACTSMVDRKHKCFRLLGNLGLSHSHIGQKGNFLKDCNVNYIPLTALFLRYTIPAPFVLSWWQPSHLLLSYVPEEDASGIHMLACRVNHEATTKALLPQYMLKALDFIVLQWGRCVVTLP